MVRHFVVNLRSRSIVESFASHEEAVACVCVLRGSDVGPHGIFVGLAAVNDAIAGASRVRCFA